MSIPVEDTDARMNLRTIVRGKPFTKGHDPRRTVTKGGRHSADFTAQMRALASSEEVLDTLRSILADANHPLWLKAFAYCADRGYGKPHQSIDVTSAGQPLGDKLRLARVRLARSRAEITTVEISP